MYTLENLFSRCLKAAADRYPFAGPKLAELTMRKLSSEDMGGLTIAYSVIAHEVYLTPEFEVQATKVLASNDVIQIIDLTHIISHEILHGASYRLLEDPSNAKAGKIHSGICTERIEDGQHIVHWDSANEMLTNQYSIPVIATSVPLDCTPEQIKGHVMTYFGVTLDSLTEAALCKLIGSELIENAYFFGNKESMLKACELKGFNCGRFFETLDDLSGSSDHETIGFFKQLGIDVKLSRH